MQTENDVLDRLAKHLLSHGYEIRQQLHTGQTGVDLIAQKDNEILYVEAKGETSSKETSRAGKTFSGSQIKSHVGQAILASFKIISDMPAGVNTKAAIALPNNLGHSRLIDRILPALNQVGIRVYLVDSETVIEL